MQYFFIFLFSVSLNLFSQTIDIEEIIEQQKKLTESASFEIQEPEDQKDQESLEEKKSLEEEDSLNLEPDAEPPTESNSFSVFGYDFFDKVPTTVTALSDLPIPNDYVLSANDQLRITSVGSESFTYTVQVGLDGSILIPNIGKTNSYGKKLSEVRESIKAIISQAYPGSIADISLINLSAKKISIIGAVSNPGTYIVNPFTTISNAIAYAGGVQNYGSLRSINYMSASGKSLEFDLYDFLVKGDRSNDLVVNSGDTILVNGTDNFIRITGEVIRPMTYEYKSTDTFRDILSFALGPKSSANIKNISISANQDGSNVTIFPDLDIPVADMALSSMYLEENLHKKIIQYLWMVKLFQVVSTMQKLLTNF